MFEPELSNEDLNAGNVEQNRINVLSEIDETIVVVDTCTIVASVCDQPLDDVPVPVSSEIQAIFIHMSVRDFVVTPKLVALLEIQ